MQTYYEPARDIPVYGRYDVVVAGGGCAGFASALAAARNGASVLIVEQYACFGGTATAGLMINLVGFRNQVKPDEIQVCRGIGEELILRLLACGGAGPSANAYPSPRRSDQKGDLSYNFLVDAERFKHTTMQMLIEAGVHILLHTFVADVIREGGTVKGIIIENKSGRQAVLADITIDCTGDADVAYRAQAPFWQAEKGDSRLMDCLMYRISGFGPEPGIYSCLDGDTMVVWGPLAPDRNCADADELTQSEIATRSAVYEDLAEKKKKYPELSGAKVVETPMQIGIRQTRFIKGEYTLTGEDVLEGRHFEDSIAVGINPVIAYYGYRRFLTHDGYQIPYRCLIPQQTEGLLVAGRCISADQIAFESYRAMAHILSIGEGAGVAAALCAREHVPVRALNIAQLQQTLKAQGAKVD